MAHNSNTYHTKAPDFLVKIIEFVKKSLNKSAQIYSMYLSKHYKEAN